MIRERAYGVMVGAAVGDALGMPLEFGRPRRGQDQVAKMIAGRLPAGTFTEDTEMALALGVSLADHGGFDAEFRAMLENAPSRRAEELPNTGWVRHTLESAIWALSTTANYAECVIAAANLGGDADTSACVAGAMAGALYGLEGIPARWREQVRGEYPLHSGQLWREAELIALTARLIDISTIS
jgi:ADP-ribosylglycohydrolase